VLSPIACPASTPAGRKCGDGRDEEAPTLLTALWFEGRMLRDGDVGTGGGGICCEDARRGAVARTWGDGGTELRSGMAHASDSFGLKSCQGSRSVVSQRCKQKIEGRLSSDPNSRKSASQDAARHQLASKINSGNGTVIWPFMRPPKHQLLIVVHWF